MIALDPAQASPAAKTLLDQVKARLGVTPNMTRTMAHAPAVLEGYLGLLVALDVGVMYHKLREKIALLVAEENGCEYCLAAHGALGKMAGIPAADITASRTGKASDPREQAALTLAQRIVAQRGSVDDADLRLAREGGLSEAEICEVIGHVVINVFTNYFNLAVGTEVDFPRLEPLAAVASHG
jgi:uncharacterized peroxidase-related enzyme